MRTTLDLDIDAYHVAKAIAKQKKISLGKAVSEIVLGTGKQATSDSGIRLENGIPTFGTQQVLTPEMVSELLNDE